MVHVLEVEGLIIAVVLRDDRLADEFLHDDQSGKLTDLQRSLPNSASREYP